MTRTRNDAKQNGIRSRLRNFALVMGQSRGLGTDNVVSGVRSDELARARVRVLADADPPGRQMDLDTATGISQHVVHRDVVLFRAFRGNRSGRRHGTSPRSADHRFGPASSVGHFGQVTSAFTPGSPWAPGM